MFVVLSLSGSPSGFHEATSPCFGTAGRNGDAVLRGLAAGARLSKSDGAAP
jgi:hypothetical protein